MYRASLLSILLFVISASAQAQQWDYQYVSYGDEERQWLNIHMVESELPTPVYVFAHSNGSTADGMSQGQLDAIASAGYSTVSWESIATIQGPQDALTAWDDAQLMFDWVRANAATYNLDADQIIVGGRSRGSVVSWPLFHSDHPAIQGGYFYNPLPQGTWAQPELWSPVDNITADSRPTYFAFGPDRDDDDGHNPVNADPAVERYEELGIADRLTTTEGMWNIFHDENANWTNDAEIMEYFPAFAASLADSSSLTYDQASDLAQHMYVAYYGRPADPDGQSYWAGQFQASASLINALDAFGNSSEYQDNYAHLSSSELVNNLYQQMFNRDAEPSGLAFYMGRLESGEATLASIAKQIADGAENDDLTALGNKILVSNHFTETVESDGHSYTASHISDAQLIIADVSHDEDSLIEGQAHVDNYFFSFDPGKDEEEGYNSLFMGHSFFVPIAREMSFHAEQLGLEGHTQYVEASGGATGTPMALWKDEGHRSNIQAVLDTGEVELFGMAFESFKPTVDGYVLWIDYALSNNPNTKFVIGIPWRDYPADYEDADAYAGSGEIIDTVWGSQLDTLRSLYPDVEFISMAYGFAAVELRYLFEAGQIPGVTELIGDNPQTSLFKDTKGHGHADGLLLDLAEYIWLATIYDIDLDTYDYDAGHTIDLKPIVNEIMEKYAEYFD